MEAWQCIEGEDGQRLHYQPGEGEAAVVICPGGGYSWLSPREGEPVAEAFRAQGLQPLILEYTVEPAPLGRRPLKQAAWAVEEARRLNPGRPVLVCGFSAGGHLAASIGVHWNDETLFGAEAVRERRFRPDGLILAYPVITAGPSAHRRSIRCLAGEGDDSYYSLENFVTADTPPVFLWHTAEDESVPVENSFLFAAGLRAKKVPFELHVYPFGVHGLSLATEEVAEPEKKRYPDTEVAGWFDNCCRWIRYMTRRKAW